MLPNERAAQGVLFALYCAGMKALMNLEQYAQAQHYVRRVFALAERIPPQMLTLSQELARIFLSPEEARVRALIYDASIVSRYRPQSRRVTGTTLARYWQDAPNAYYRAWMMSQAASLLVMTGERETAQEWSLMACKEADTGDTE